MVRPLGILVLALSLALVAACPGEGEGTGDGGSECPASEASHVWLLPFGPLSHDVKTSGKAALTVIVVQGSDQEGQGKTLPGQTVSFKVITSGGDAKLSAESVGTSADGLASVTLDAGLQEKVYQVQASSTGTCAVTFTVDVRKPLRQLKAVTPSPYDTFTSSRVPIAVEATTDSYAKLSGEDITFVLKLGKSAETLLAPVTGGSSGHSLQAKTDGSGRATAMLTTGSKAISQLVVEATLSGTEPVQVVVRISEGKNKGCTDDSECPLGYTCKQSVCQAQPTTPSTGCKSDADCASPTICQTTTGQCLEPTGKTCDPVEGTGCATDEVCVGYKCAKVPSSCTDNSTCPTGWVCQSGTCVPGGKPSTGGCTTNSTCPSGNICVNGTCTPKSSCTITHALDRMKGTWQYDSTLKLRDALSPVVKGILNTSSVLRDIIQGKFSIKGVPSFISGIVGKYLQSLINKYVPPWGQSLITALAEVNDIVQTMRVVSTVQVTSVGNDRYVNSEQWDLVEFNYKGTKISSPPSAISQIGQVKVPSYTSSEVCGTYYIDKHKISNVVGGLVLWAINTTLSAVTCSIKSSPCFSSVDQALQTTINCQMLGVQLDAMVQSFWSGAPSVASIVTSACDAEKNKLINNLKNELAGISTKLSLLELSGVVAIPNPHTQLSGGKWYGTLGTSVVKGNFEGDFSAKQIAP